jgi:serine/threonine protein kinase
MPPPRRPRKARPSKRAARAPARALGPGDRVGDFRLVREVGRGAMGVVFEARQVSLPRRVAVKTLLGGDRDARRRFPQEARAVARLSHPGIAPVFAVGSTRGTPWYAMEFLEGENLRDVVRARALHPRVAATYVRDAARAVEHAHARGVLHRDVKPRNLVLGRGGRVVLTDFGLAKPLVDGRVKAEGSAVGTPFYMSPEQARGDVPVGPATDVYGLGVTLYTLLARRPPFSEKDTVLLEKKIREEAPPRVRSINRAVPVDLALVVERAMRKDPAERHPSAAALADDLDRFLRGEPVLGRTPTALARARAFVGRHRGGVAVASALLGLGALALLLAGDEKAKTPAKRRRPRRPSRARRARPRGR